MEEIKLDKKQIDLDGDYRILPMGEQTKRLTLSIPVYLLRMIDAEASARGKSRSMVASYLILCGIKAHLGTFKAPAKNLIKERLTRGKHG